MLYLINKTTDDDSVLLRPLAAVDGYLFLGLPSEALKELDGIAKKFQKCPAVLGSRIRALLHMKKWKEAEKLSHEGMVLYPTEDEFPVQRAFALDQLDEGDKAAEAIMAAPDWIRRTGILHYNLGCYEARLGDPARARECIRLAIKINSSFRKNARQDLICRICGISAREVCRTRLT